MNLNKGIHIKLNKECYINSGQREAVFHMALETSKCTECLLPLACPVYNYAYLVTNVFHQPLYCLPTRLPHTAQVPSVDLPS